ncbi:MAG TPA: thiazole synthase, partial [Candidatus Avalokitesvara rifleensis]
MGNVLLKEATKDKFRLGKYEFTSRLFVGTGKYPSMEVMRQALEASGTEVVTVAVRRLSIKDRPQESLLDYIDTKKYTILPNTAGCYSADEAIRTAHLAREAGISDMIKLEVLGDEKTLLPDPVDTLKAAQQLVKDGFTVLVYTT